MTDQYQKKMEAVMETTFRRLEHAEPSEKIPVYETRAWKEWREEGSRLTQSQILDPAEYLICLYDLNELEQFCFLLLIEAELEEDRMTERLRRSGFSSLSPIAVMSLFEGERCFSQKLFGSFLKGGRLWGWILPKMKQDRPSPSEPLKLDGRIRNLVLGEQWDDRELDPYGFWIYPQNVKADEMKGSFGEKEYRQWSSMFRTGTGTEAVLLRGPEGIGKKTQIRRYALEYDRPIFCADCGILEELSEEQGQNLTERIVRECRIQQALLCVDDKNGQEQTGRYRIIERMRQLAARYLDGFLLLQSGEMKEKGIAGTMIPVTIPMPSLREAAEIWREKKREFPCSCEIRPEEFAGMMAMTPAQIGRAFIFGESLMRRDGCTRMTTRHLKEACSSLASGKMEGKAVRVRSNYTFEDLILPARQKRLLKETCSQVKNRYRVMEEWGFGGKQAYGTGISIVFSGPPGTGKTMAAQVMAGELGLELYKVDLSAVVSKYIGETEKNLNLIFEEGRKNQAVLFFDEADVLFSKRTEVRDSHDKYSNMEAAFLLQKMEEYTGVAILATNYIQNMDDAFRRRLTCMVDFPFPDTESRKRLWRTMVPDALQLDEGVDLDFLADTMELSGSQIRSSLLNAAFLAAEAGETAVTMKDLLKSVEKELHKSGRKLTRETLGEYGHLLEETEGDL